MRRKFNSSACWLTNTTFGQALQELWHILTYYWLLFSVAVHLVLHTIPPTPLLLFLSTLLLVSENLHLKRVQYQNAVSVQTFAQEGSTWLRLWSRRNAGLVMHQVAGVGGGRGQVSTAIETMTGLLTRQQWSILGHLVVCLPWFGLSKPSQKH